MTEPIKIEKKPWQKPELIILVRSKPEEMVLSSCKISPTSGGGPNSAQPAFAGGCISVFPCAVCSSFGTS